MAFTGDLGQMDLATAASALAYLQRAAGNLVVQRALDAATHVERYPLVATIRQVVTQRADGDDAGQAPPAGGPPAMPGGELQDGETADLPVYTSDYPEDGEEAPAEADSIESALTYSPTVSVLPDEPRTTADFGSTWGNHIRTSGGRIHKEPGKFQVSLTYENPITIKVYRDLGPHKQVNIDSETDPDITKSNFPTVASDLTPGSDNRPPRTQFWARDLTLVHEQFHATDGQRFCSKAVADAQADLNTKTASSKDDVNNLLQPIPNQIIAARGAGMASGGEDRAYADGAAKYKDRATKITANGKAGKYP